MNTTEKLGGAIKTEKDPAVIKRLIAVNFVEGGTVYIAST